CARIDSPYYFDYW
nr:immunoglobulin heavy chain junction region [Mus musculus]NSM08141.1 immunoglobulin heavy chain junction region [Mus musculus]